MELITISAILFVIHGLVGVIDGAYFHLRKYKLYAHPESFEEHVTHSLRSLTLTLSAWLLFVENVGGWLLWTAVAVLVVDLIVQTWDVLIERRSRTHLGGLSSVEYLVHTHAIFLAAGFWTVAFISKPVEAWSFSSPAFLAEDNPFIVVLIGWVMGASALFATIQHFWLCHPKYRQEAEQEVN